MTFVGCPSCGMELKPRFFESRDYAPCHVCGARLSVLGFPAMLRGVVSISATDANREVRAHSPGRATGADHENVGEEADAASDHGGR